MDKVSIIIPSFNRGNLIGETLNSVINQTHSDWECIVVDDGSIDTTKEVIREYEKKDARIKLYERERQPKGACACRNIGVANSVGELLVFLDSDDLLEPFCLKQRVEVMKCFPNLDFSIFPSLMFENHPNDLGLWWNIDKEVDELTRQFHQDAICQSTGVIWRRASFNKLGQWDEALHLWQDIDLFFRAYIQDYEYKKFFNLPPDLHNRRLATSLSRNDFFSSNKTQSRIEVVQRAVNLLNKYEKESYLPEAKYMLSEIISGLSRNIKPLMTLKLIRWGENEKVFSKKEANNLRFIVFIRYFRLSKLFYFSKKIHLIDSEFSVGDCTLGILPHKASTDV